MIQCLLESLTVSAGMDMVGTEERIDFCRLLNWLNLYSEFFIKEIHGSFGKKALSVCNDFNMCMFEYTTARSICLSMRNNSYSFK